MPTVARWMPPASNANSETKMKLTIIAPVAMAAVFGITPAVAEEWISGSDEAAVQAVMRASFTPRNEAQLDRLEQSFMQKECSVAEMTGEPMSNETIQRIQSEARASVKFPEDGEYLGDWREGEKIAQS